MLRLLWRERGRPVSRERFLEVVLGHERFPTTRTVDQHMVKLRQKVERDPVEPRYLVTAFGADRTVPEQFVSRRRCASRTGGVRQIALAPYDQR
ncbi:MAG: winged helix-turn-helix domain-containing protein [Planctomycetes bacterium]|nr:winged helix-turn-helix domain-containing protein [Planctomycetota bacterium]